MLGEPPPLEQALERAREHHPLAAELVEPLLSLTVAPTMARASGKRNVIPAVCELTVDCRLLPGPHARGRRAVAARRCSATGDYDLEWIERWGGTRSAVETPLWRPIEDFVGELEPGARVAPICSAGFTDSHWLREAFGTVAYGFFPARAMEPELAARLIHSADERVPVDDLELGVEFLRAAAAGAGAR